ncbi:HD-GYP domain-containing protein [bacterium]|nr:HD-GYP domain-containing protein [bacterium]
MYVSQLDRPWIETPFLVHGFTIKNAKELNTLQSHCRYVYIDIKKGATRAPDSYRRKPSELTEHNRTASFEDNLSDAIPIYSNAKDVVDNLYKSLRSGRMFAVEDIKDTVSDCVDNIISNPDSMLWLSMIKNKDEYTAEHSLNVALLSIALGREEGLKRVALQQLGICSMLHDVGKIKIPDKILNKEGSLSAPEFEVMKTHTVHGKKLLLNYHDLPSAAVDVALSHHERIDGKGYPRGLQDDDIPYFVRIVCIADAYDAMTSGRVYSDAKPAAEALKILLANKNTQFDTNLATQFVNCIGVYPAGSIAELNSGAVGIVIPSNTGNKLQPRLLMIRDEEKTPCEPHAIELEDKPKTDSGKPLFIRTLHPEGSFGVNIKDYQSIVLDKNY